MGGDDGPRTIIDGSLVAARHLQIGLLLGRRQCPDRTRAVAPSGRARARHPDPPHAGTRRDGGAGVSGAAPKAPRVDPGRGRGGARRTGGRPLLRRPHRGLGDGCGRRVRPAGGHRPSRARHHHPDASEAGRAARFGRNGGVPSAASRPVRDDGRGVFPTRVRPSGSARRPPLGRRRGGQGQRADPRRAPAAEGRPDQLRRQRRRPRRLCR